MLSPLSRSIIFQTVFDLKRVSIDKHEINLGNVCAPPSEWKWQAVRAWKRRLSVTSDKFDSLNKWTSAELMVQPHCNVENGMCGTEFPFVINFLGFFVVVEKCCGYQFHVERIKWILRDGNSKHVCNFLSLFDVCVCVFSLLSFRYHGIVEWQCAISPKLNVDKQWQRQPHTSMLDVCNLIIYDFIAVCSAHIVPFTSCIVRANQR